ncbi:hypothetical protein [Alkalihalobacillus pseudalcaliphilus]|uniref:hypothetical protein n=1 Tax=Alkalihalobacillus pseudalcaliphilus TaxID=79884 RepID=UPI00064E086A|nr:hypothetical protein [Alkalihalobacillus pseudalcaliphilus]KMK74974.1 hypothetical protein AB990_15975 [Alkalihalobacillus pseudalcaliphilus]
MLLLLFTIGYCIIVQFLDISYAVGIYLIGLALVKGFMSEQFVDIFNLYKTKFLYKRIGFKSSFLELLSLILIFINILLIDFEPFTLFEIVYVVFLLIFVYVFYFGESLKPLAKKEWE